MTLIEWDLHDWMGRQVHLFSGCLTFVGLGERRRDGEQGEIWAQAVA